MRHPLHPALVHFPVACWSLAVISDVASLFLGETAWRWSAGLLTAGCCTAIIAMCAGLLELPKMPEGPPLTDCYWHMGFMFLALTLFSFRLLASLENMQPVAPDAIALALDAAGFISLTAGGWYGGKLVYQHGVGRSDENDN